MDDQRPDATEQVERFKQAARDLGCDEDEAAWDERLKKVARHKPVEKPK
ncbi:MAG: hypothetical protein QOK17_2496 [Sphingomonadales bacterium]|jgi:hypothetical protein|nr:hypothetical protein [Sphingomonadales bacterium]